MEKFMKFLNEKLTPLANFFGRQRHLLAMQRGFMAMISFICIHDYCQSTSYSGYGSEWWDIIHLFRMG